MQNISAILPISLVPAGAPVEADEQGESFALAFEAVEAPETDASGKCDDPVFAVNPGLQGPVWAGLVGGLGKAPPPVAVRSTAAGATVPAGPTDTADIEAELSLHDSDGHDPDPIPLPSLSGVLPGKTARAVGYPMSTDRAGTSQLSRLNSSVFDTDPVRPAEPKSVGLQMLDLASQPGPAGTGQPPTAAQALASTADETVPALPHARSTTQPKDTLPSVPVAEAVNIAKSGLAGTIATKAEKMVWGAEASTSFAGKPDFALATPLLTEMPDTAQLSRPNVEPDLAVSSPLGKAEPVVPAFANPSEASTLHNAKSAAGATPPERPLGASAADGLPLLKDQTDLTGPASLAVTAGPPEIVSGPRAIAPTYDVLPGQVASDSRPVSDPPNDDAPAADPVPDSDPQGLVPGVWERLFTGIIAAYPDGRADILHQLPGALAAPHLAMTRLAGALRGSVSDAERAPQEPVDLRAQPPNPTAAALTGSKLHTPGVGLLPKADVSLIPTEDKLDPLADGSLLFPVATGTSLSGGAAASGHAPGAPGLPVPQVAVQITTALAQNSDGSTDLALSPEELGKVRLRLRADAGNPDRMVVMITFERPETLELFRRHAGELADALRSAGYAGADIGFSQDGGFASGSDQRGSPSGFAPGRPHQAEPSEIPPSPARLLAGASLDLRL